MSKFIPILLILFIIFPIFVFAQQAGGSPPSTLSLPNPLAVQSFEGLITAIINWLLLISLPIIVLLLLYAGFQFMITGASPEGRKNSINIIKYAIIGYAIMLMAKVLVGVIIGLFSGSSPSTTSAPSPIVPPPIAPAVTIITLTADGGETATALPNQSVLFKWDVRNNTGRCSTSGDSEEWSSIVLGEEVSYSGSKGIIMPGLGTADSKSLDFIISCRILQNEETVVLEDVASVDIRQPISGTTYLALFANDSTTTIADIGGDVKLSWIVPDPFIKCKATSNPRVLDWDNITTEWWRYYNQNQPFVGFRVIEGIGINFYDEYKFTLACEYEGVGDITKVSVSVDIID